jgi:uncharacterized Zn finger protein
LPAGTWKSICADCAGRVASLVELLQGRLSKAVMDRVCRQGDGLFPKPAGIRFSSCPDSASLCKHGAAALYGTGTRLDAEPELLFRLRAVDAGGLFADLDAALSAARGGGAGVYSSDLADIFGIDMVAPAPAPRGKASTPANPSPAVKISRPKTAAAESTTPARKRRLMRKTLLKKGVRKTHANKWRTDVRACPEKVARFFRSGHAPTF